MIRIRAKAVTVLVALAALALGLQAGPAPARGDGIHVVVLGSSTAQGVGASVPDSAWVNRYRAALVALNPDHRVTNLALGGYTTWHIRPTGAPYPPDRPAPDPARNVTEALSLEPDAIIVNLPSNDVAAGYPIAEQIENYDMVRSLALAEGVPVWFTTPQPRNFSQAMRDSLIVMRDLTFALYGRYAIDFWTGLAAADGTILAQYNSGDGIHLNDAGHRLLFQRTMAEDIPTYHFVGVEDPVPGRMPRASVSFLPQPARGATIARFTLARDADVAIALYDVRGRRVSTWDQGWRQAGAHAARFDVSGLPSGLYFCALEAGGSRVVVARLTVMR